MQIPMSERELIREKRKADAMRRLTPDPECHYWSGYRIGLVGRSDHHEALLSGIGSEDLARDARGRGYRDG